MKRAARCVSTLQAGALLAAAGLGACHRSPSSSTSAADAASDGGPNVVASDEVSQPFDAKGPNLAAIDMQVNVYSRPDPTSPRLGYLRLGTVVLRDPRPAGTDRCPRGWYRIQPRGYVCANKAVTFDVDDPLVRAASVRPDTTKPLPYKYAFLTGASPLYLRVPNSEEQKRAEYHLTYHEGWWERHHEEVTRVELGANDVAIDGPSAALAAAGGPTAAGQTPVAVVPAGAVQTASASAPKRRLSTELSLGELMGGQTDDDPIPFWLEGGRTIANVADYKPGPSAYFAKKAWRHTGLALIGAFRTGPESRSRSFAITVDLRLVPVDRMKPDTGSPFHGVELSNQVTLPLAFVRDECDPKNGKACTHAYRMADDGPHQLERTYAYRSPLQLSGKKLDVEGMRYYETKEGEWVRRSDVGAAFMPESWPLSARNGQKWIEVSILQQTMVLWEGQKPVYVTLVSTGQDGMKDPKTTKSTPLGFFRIQSKHVTATMDANEQSAQGKTPEASDKEIGEAKMSFRDSESGSKSVETPRGEAADTAKGESGEKQSGRPEGSFELRDVPYVQYFSSGYALHGAYWHDVFGKARSHGCINLSPIDAHRLFHWTDPPIADRWHAVFAGKETGRGTLVMVHQ